jgi:NADPH:quinone reductase-like Zn-dependent oxidoreductase
MTEATTRAVQLDERGDIDVLKVRDVPRPVPAEGEVLVAVKAAGINPGEAMIRKGLLDDRYPAALPSGQGSDLAGVVVQLGGGVEGFAVGDEVLGFSFGRSSHAEFVSVPAEQLTRKPASVSWAAAGGLYVAGSTAYAAVRSVELKAGEVVAVAGAAGAWARLPFSSRNEPAQRFSASRDRRTTSGSRRTA